MDIVALMAEDIDLVAPVLTERVRLWPGTLRGFADAWDAAGRPPRPRPVPEAQGGAYDPARYWGRLHERGDLSTVGQSARSAALNRWLYRALETNLRSFVRRHALVVPPPTAAFDVGVGIGYWVRVWRELGIARVDGCDLVPLAIESARRAAAEAGVAGEYFVADLGQPGVFDGRSYPIVSCFNVLLHVVDDDAFRIALHNTASLVAPGGWLLLAEPILRDATQARPFDPAQHSRSRPLAAYRDPLVEAGLELVALERATVLANNPQEAGSPWAWRRLEGWWRFVVRRDRAGARWIGPLVAAADRVAMRTGVAPTTKFALFRRPPVD
jgi:2-polyprenyl-3-methyl-5-hydroxy-6-metoxy-1,4-benzoquinol methylase